MNTAARWLLALAVVSLTACAANSASEVSADEANADETAAVTASGGLTLDQSRIVRRQLDNICGDTWCSGDYNFRFQRVTCNAVRGTCTVTMMINHIDDTRTVYWRSCRVGGYTGFDSLVSTAPNGYQSLDQDFYMAMTDCIQRIEPNLPRP